MQLLLVFLLNFYHAYPPIVIGRDTTFISGPLRRDGLPDYEAFMRDQCRAGVTPENNAAVPFWQAMWPSNLERPDYDPMLKELGLKETPAEKDRLQLLYGEATRKRIIDWLHLKADEDDPDDYVSPAIASAWTSEQFPPLAAWVDANKRPIDLLVEASHRPRFYSPSPTLLNKQHEMLLCMLLPGSQNVREAIRALGVRAMRHVGENRLQDAWIDLLAMHRLSRLAAQGPTLVDQLIAVACANIANDGTLALLSSDRLTPELARQVQTDLDSLPNITRMAECINNQERLTALDSVVHMKLHGMGTVIDGLSESSRNQPDWTKSLSFDGNIAMRRLNHWYDRIDAIMKIRDHKAREKAFAKYNADLTAEGQRVRRPFRIVAAIFSLKSRSESLGSILACLLIVPVETVDAAQERGFTQLQLIRVAAALAVYRVEHRSYPAKFEDLVPGVVKKLPIDVYNSKPFIYKRTKDGYLLYCAGSNGVDDGGDNSQMSLRAGQAIEETGHSESPESQPELAAEADDFSVVLPHPKFKLKTVPATGPIH